jgi:subtilisin-like proprotein convertase family protein
MAILRVSHSIGWSPAWLVAIALVASLGGCTDFSIADAESADAAPAVEEPDAEPVELPDATPVRMESAMQEVRMTIPDQDSDGVKDIAQIIPACTIVSAEVDVDIRHVWRGDIVVHLTSPAGTLVVLKVYVDEDPLDDVVGTYPTTLMPEQPLTALAGEEGMGAWTITVSDQDLDDIGTFETWGLRLLCQ